MKVYTRAEWGGRPAIGGRLAHQDSGKIAEVFIHHSDGPGIAHTFEQAAQIVRGLQDFHMRVRGWADIAYHYVLVQNARHDRGGLAWVFEGRPLSVVPAAQLNHNQGTAAICIAQKDPEPLHENTRWRAGRLARHIDSAHVLRGHYEVTGTECPGAVIRPQLAAIAHIAGLARAPGR